MHPKEYLYMCGTLAIIVLYLYMAGSLFWTLTSRTGYWASSGAGPCGLPWVVSAPSLLPPNYYEIRRTRKAVRKPRPWAKERQRESTRCTKPSPGGTSATLPHPPRGPHHFVNVPSTVVAHQTLPIPHFLLLHLSLEQQLLGRVGTDRFAARPQSSLILYSPPVE